MIIVSNAGTHPEPAHLAAGLTSAGTELTYMTSASWACDSRLMTVADSSYAGKSRIATQIRRRRLPTKIKAEDTVATAPALEGLFQALMRVDCRGKDLILERRNRRHRRKVARLIQASINLDAVIAQYHSAYEPFMAADGHTRKILMYPIAHHHWMQKTMNTEARLNPEWAEFLQGYKMPSWKQNLLDAEINLADTILVPSSFVASTFMQAGIDSSKLLVQNLGADLPPLNMSSRKNTGHASHKTTFLFAGQVNQRKGIGYVLEAFSQLNANNAELLIAGQANATMRERLSSYSNVKYLGTMPRQDLYNVMASSDALILPSFAEGFPLAAIEAMANACVPIVSKYTFASDVITDGENGFVVDAGSVDQLVQQMTIVIDDPTRIQAIKRAAELTARSYTWRAYEQNAASAVKHLISGHFPASHDHKGII